MRQIHLYLCLAIFIYSCNSANDYLQKADVAIEKENYREATKLSDKALAKKKYLSEAYIAKAYCYTKLNKDDSAILVYNQLISYLPNNTLALYNIGLCKFKQEKLSEAILYFNSAMVTKGYNPEDSSKYRMIMEYTPAGKELFGEQDKFDVPFSEIFYMAGLANYEIGQISKAYSYFNNCISRKYNIAESYYMIGLCWLASNEKEKACESFRNSSFQVYAKATEQFDKTCK